MRVADIMTREPETIHPTATLEEAASKMRGLDVGPLPVCEDGRVLGIVTDRDIAVRSTAEGHDPSRTMVREAMTRDAIYVFDDEDVEAAERAMREHQIRRVLVLNRDRRLVGIVSLGDIAVDADDDRRVGQTLEEVSEPAEPRR